MFGALRKILFACFVALITIYGGASIGNAAEFYASPVAFSEQMIPLKLADAMQMPAENHTHEHQESHMNMEHDEMQGNESHVMIPSQAEQSIDAHEEHKHAANGETNEGHEHQHDARTMGAPGEGPNWPLIEGFAFFNMLVIGLAGVMKWKKKEKIQ